MTWLIFIASSVVIVLAAIKLAAYGDVIAVRTRLGGMFIGALLLAGATSLPELVTAISSIQQTVPNLAAGNFFGSNMFNMLLLAVLDMIFFQARLDGSAGCVAGRISRVLPSGRIILFVLARYRRVSKGLADCDYDLVEPKGATHDEPDHCFA
jgi:Ca2+/Na+ antiporter